MSNLVKGYFVNLETDDARVIDNNELVNQLILEKKEEEAKRRAKLAEAENDAYYDDYDPDEGDIDMEKLDRLTQDQSGFEDMPAEMNLTDFGGEQDDVSQEAPATPVVPPNTQKEIDQILDDAQTQANSIVADARAEAEKIRKKAQEEGRKQGFDQGLNEGLAEAEKKSAQLLKAQQDNLTAEYERMLMTIEPEMVETLTKIYEHVFNISFREDKDIILHLLQTSLSRIEPSGGLIVHVSPDDYDMIFDAKNDLMQNVTNPDINMELVEDPTLHENECIIETDGGIFDCSVGVELEELSRKIRLLSYDRRK
ncbi:FliH/SctL family protein [Butyrivibrio sp. MC2013]|uniref:FliH/SctL family protein n=1 Tax=Butyrivibrio sp. MC2013 TaxID=1280686 RepID=UPI000424FC87|nr:FliH/SctL family protein [Butyrivibrio sp. MC2013]